MALDDFLDYYTNVYDEIYGDGVVGLLHGLFEDKRSTEAFFAVNAQIDALVDYHGVPMWEAEYRDISVWTVDLVISAMYEIAQIARSKHCVCWPTILALATSMRLMVEMAPHGVVNTTQVEEPGEEPDPKFMAVREILQDADNAGPTIAVQVLSYLEGGTWERSQAASPVAELPSTDQ